MGVLVLHVRDHYYANRFHDPSPIGRRLAFRWNEARTDGSATGYCLVIMPSPVGSYGGADPGAFGMMQGFGLSSFV